MTLSGFTATRTDGGLGLPSSDPNRFLYVLYAAGATVNTLHEGIASSTAARAIGSGWGIDAVCHKLDVDGGQVDILTSAAATAASNGAVTASGTGATVTVAGTAIYPVVCVIYIRLGGALGTGRFQYTLDGGRTLSGVLTIPTGGTYLLGSSGITATFAAGTYVVSETYSFTCVPACPTVANLEEAFAVALASDREWGCVVWCARIATCAGAATMGAAVAALHADLEDTGRYSRALIDAGAEARSAAATAWASGATSSYLHVVHGRVPIRLGTGSVAYKVPLMPYLAEFARRAAKVKFSTNPAWVGLKNDKGLLRIGLPEEDDFADGEVLTPLKLIGPRTYPGKGKTVLPSNAFTFSADGSDYTTLQRGRVVDEMSKICRDGLMPYVNSTLRVARDGSGHVASEEAALIDTEINEQLDRLLENGTTDRGTIGHVSGVTFATDQTNDFLSTNTLQGSCSGVPLGDAFYVNITIGLARSA